MKSEWFYEVYGSNGCSWCMKAVQLLSEKQKSFVNLKLGEDYNAKEFKALANTNNWYPSTVPMILRTNKRTEEQEFVGGYTTLETLLELEEKS